MIKEAILRSLEDLKTPCTSRAIYDHIVLHKYYQSRKGKTLDATVSALLGNFIRNGDTRIKRIKGDGGAYLYYLTKYEELINVRSEVNIKKLSKSENKSYHERDLHILLSTYLQSIGIYSKTIYHEKSKKEDQNQKWIHPDMVGVKFLNLQNKVSQSLLKAVNREDTFKIYSYELKKEINTDSELKKYFFQTVSNSNWANFGYLVAFEISNSLYDEMERLNQSYGIGIIELNTNPYESKILFQAKYRELNFKTIDKICRINTDFENFISQTEKLLTAEDRYIQALEKQLKETCDNYFQSDSDIEKYCKAKRIPVEIKDDRE